MVFKKILKLFVKHMPIFQLRAAMLRWCGYGVGKEVFIGEDLIIIDELEDRGMVTIGDRAAIAPRVTLVVSSRPNASRIAPYVNVNHGPIVIESDAWIGTGVVVFPNTRIGEGAIVSANSVVTQDVKPYTLVGGQPARMIKMVSVPWVNLKKDPAP
jgi:maltose O-acetyltransferase